jgi:glycosyltransferase involved in cell wall biosynthesis
MFEVFEPPVPYADPWTSPLSERMPALCRGKRRVAYLYERPDNSTFRYRVYNMIQLLQLARPEVGAAYFTQDELGSLSSVIGGVSTLVVCRYRYSHELNRLITRARALGTEVVFDCDDLVFDTRFVNLIVETLDQDLGHPGLWDFWFAYISRIGEAMRLCDRVITTNEFLADRVTQYSGQSVSVVPNFLNREQLAISRRIQAEKVARRYARNGEVWFGYFSGTPSHNRDFEVVASALRALLAEDSRVRLLVVGYLDLKQALSGFERQVVQYPLHDFVNLQRLMSLVEFNLVPLQENVFTNCKSELKFFEAAAVGTLTLATPTFSYRRAIDDGLNGYLCGACDWRDRASVAMKALGGYPAMAAAAHARAMERYAWHRQLGTVQRAVWGNDVQVTSRHGR